MKRFLITVCFVAIYTCTLAADRPSHLVILPLGDSILRGESKQYYSQRFWLWKKLIEHGWASPDMIGSRRYLKNNAIPANGWPWVNGHYFDDHSEAWPGYRGSHHPMGIPNVLNLWIPTYTEDPDVVLFHIGSNDAINLVPVNQLVQGIKDSIDILRTYFPDVVIMVARIPRMDGWRGDRCNAYIDDFNNRVVNDIVPSKNNWNQRVLACHMNGINPSTQLFDDLHPNTSGEQYMSDRWFDLIKGIGQPDGGNLKIRNRDFEAQPVANGQVKTGKIIGWYNSNHDSRIVNWGSSSPYGSNPPGMFGDHCAVVEHATGVVYQSYLYGSDNIPLNWDDPYLQEDKTYTLSMYLGNRGTGYTFAGCTLRLIDYWGYVVGEKTIETPPGAPGTFAKVEVKCWKSRMQHRYSRTSHVPLMIEIEKHGNPGDYLDFDYLFLEKTDGVFLEDLPPVYIQSIQPASPTNLFITFSSHRLLQHKLLYTTNMMHTFEVVTGWLPGDHPTKRVNLPLLDERGFYYIETDLP